MKVKIECPPLVVMSLLLMAQVRMSLLSGDKVAKGYYVWSVNIYNSLSQIQRKILLLTWAFGKAIEAVERLIERHDVFEWDPINGIKFLETRTTKRVILIVVTPMTEKSREYIDLECRMKSDMDALLCTIDIGGEGHCAIFRAYMKFIEYIFTGIHTINNISPGTFPGLNEVRNLVLDSILSVQIIFTHNGYMTEYQDYVNRTISALLSQSTELRFAAIGDNTLIKSLRRDTCINGISEFLDEGICTRQGPQSDRSRNSIGTRQRDAGSFIVSDTILLNKGMLFLEVTERLLNQIKSSDASEPIIKQLNRHSDNVSITSNYKFCRCSDLLVISVMVFGELYCTTVSEQSSNNKGESFQPIGLRVKYIDTYSRESWMETELGPVKPSWPVPVPWQDNFLNWGGGRIPG